MGAPSYHLSDLRQACIPLSSQSIAIVSQSHKKVKVLACRECSIGYTVTIFHLPRR